jgi:uncharacterized protein YndB with AHSA1/START domain
MTPMTPSTQSLVIERKLDASVEEVFAAWTDPEIIAKWFFVDPSWSVQAEADLKVGGNYRLAMTTAEGEVHTMTGQYMEIDRPHRLSFTWSSHVAKNTRVTVELSPTGKGTLLRLTHEVPSEAVAPHEAGWRGCLDNLQRLLGR